MNSCLNQSRFVSYNFRSKSAIDFIRQTESQKRNNLSQVMTLCL